MRTPQMWREPHRLLTIVLAAFAVLGIAPPARAQPACPAGGWSQRSVAVSPPPRTGHAVAYDPVRDFTYIFGGISASNVELADF